VTRAGVAVISGLARGIDAAAHRGALDASGITLAILGTGVDRCYPAAHRSLFAEILEHGLVVSELPPGTPPLPYHFPARNRILAGLCQAVVVVQAPARSGALVTAAHAAESGSEVLAVPGDPLLPENEGSNQLLAAGARVTLGVEDVLSAVHGHEVILPGAATGFRSGSGSSSPSSPALAPNDCALLAALDFTPRQVDEVVRATGLEVEGVLSGLLRLELAGMVESVAGGRVRWTPRAARSRRPS
jgi:DNA processing protein